MTQTPDRQDARTVGSSRIGGEKYDRRARPYASRRSRAGFSLIELVVVVTVVGILAGLGFTRLHQGVAHARATALAEDARLVRDAVFNYFVENGAWPPVGEPGEVPLGLDPFLPDGFSFDRPGGRFEYSSLPDSVGGTDGRFGLRVEVEDDPLLAKKLALVLGGEPERDGEDGWLPLTVTDSVPRQKLSLAGLP